MRHSHVETWRSHLADRRLAGWRLGLDHRQPRVRALPDDVGQRPHTGVEGDVQVYVITGRGVLFGYFYYIKGIYLSFLYQKQFSVPRCNGTRARSTALLKRMSIDYTSLGDPT